MLLKATENARHACTESAEYRRINAVLGDTVMLPCYLRASSGVKWSRNTTNGYFSYVYVNGRIRGPRNILLHFSVVSGSRGDHSLRIYNVHPRYSGLYDCYDINGNRIIGYYLIAEGMFLNTSSQFRQTETLINRRADGSQETKYYYYFYYYMYYYSCYCYTAATAAATAT